MMKYFIVGLARSRFSFLAVWIYMAFLFSLMFLDYPGFFDTLSEFSIFHLSGVIWMFSGIILDEYYWRKLLE